MNRINPTPLALVALFLSIAFLSCTSYQDWNVASAYEISAIRLDPSTGAELGSPAVLGTITPPSGAAYVWWKGASSAGAVSGGVTLINLGSAAVDTSYGTGPYYSEGRSVAMAVISQTDGDYLTTAPGSAACSLVGGAQPLVLCAGQGYAVGANHKFLATGSSYKDTSWMAAASWASGGATGLMAGYPSGDRPALRFFQTGSEVDNSDYDALAGAGLGCEDATTFLALFDSYALDTNSGKTITTVSIVSIDAAAKTLTRLGGFPIDNSTTLGAVDTLADGMLSINTGRLVFIGLDGTERGSVILTSSEVLGETVAGPYAGSGLLFTPVRQGDSRFDGEGPTWDYSFSWISAEPRRLWTKDLGQAQPQFAAAVKMPGVIVLIMAKPIGEIKVTHAYSGGF